VLELGCGSGINIMAMAQLFPEAEFLGIDSSERQISQGKDALEATGLSNAELRQADISNLGQELGEFDYVITHGIYSWVPSHVKEAILRLSRERLKPQGVAYVSYNCLPGWRMRGALRDMMLMHTASIPDLPGKVAQAKAPIKFLAESCPEDTAYGKYLRQELELLKNVDDAYIAHDFLEVDNDAVYFTDFLKAAAAAKLQYLADTDPATMIADNLPPQAAQTLKSLNLNLLATEQYMDFVRNRTFRSSLLCHEEAKLDRNLDAARLDGMEVTALVNLKEKSPDGQTAVLTGAGGTNFTVNSPWSVSLFSLLSQEGRRSMPVSTLLDRVLEENPEALKGRDAEATRADLGRLLLQGYLKRMLDLYLGAPAYPRAADDPALPVALPLARWQVGRGQKVSSPKLDMLNTDSFVAKLIALCDGTRDRERIVQEMASAVAAGEFQLQEDGKPITNPARATTIIDHLYESSLNNLSQLGLLAPAIGQGNNS
jgi:methyltransferase-like protein